MEERTAKYYELKSKYPKYITKTTLKKWVKVYEKSNGGNGITADEFKEITGEDYN
jgi:hypothetical protein